MFIPLIKDNYNSSTFHFSIINEMEQKKHQLLMSAPYYSLINISDEMIKVVTQP